MPYAARLDHSRRVTTIAGVAAIHGLIGYVFLTGMATGFVDRIVDPFTVTNIPIETPPPPPPLPTPPTLERAATQPTIAPPISATIPIVPAPADNPVVIVPLPPLPAGTGVERVAVDPPAPPVAVSMASAVAARGDRNQWISTDDYPPSALRAGEEGVVGISLAVGADGRIRSCAVTASSGHASLDQATCRLYQRRARFAPARDDAGTPVAGTFNDRIRWRLPM